MLSADRFRTDKAYNLHLVGVDNCDDRGFPLLHGQQGVPGSLVAWNACSRSEDMRAGVHFFVDDYRFESVWNCPERYVDRLSRHGYALTPDFSLYRDMPVPMQVWNVYRSRAVGAFWERSGVQVIPTLQWSTPDSYVFAFEGLPARVVYGVSSVGVRANKESLALWRAGLDRALEALEPSALVAYGSPVDFDAGDMPVRWFESPHIRRLEDGR